MIELGQFEVNFHPRMAIKGQALSDFVAKFTYFNTTEVTGMTNIAEAAKAAGARERVNFVPTKRDAE